VEGSRDARSIQTFASIVSFVARRHVHPDFFNNLLGEQDHRHTDWLTDPFMNLNVGLMGALSVRHNANQNNTRAEPQACRMQS
jgi:hypothetical protein